MHEMSIAMNIVEIAESFAKDKKASKVLSVTLDLGDLSGVMADAVLFCYDACAKGRIVEGSRLVINRIRAKAFCGDCDEEFCPENPFFVCPICEGLGVKLIAGEELQVREMEIE